MMMAEIVAVVFKYINLTVFCGGAYYIFRTHMLPSVQQRMAIKRNEIARRQAYHNKLHHDLDQISENMAQQEVVYKRLLQKAQQWQHHASQCAQQQEIERERCKKLIEQRVTIQRKQLKKEYSLVAVTPIVIEQLHQEALEYFKQDNHAQSYIDMVTKNLERQS